MIFEGYDDDDENTLIKCEMCDYDTYRRSDYNKHLITQKHKRNLLKFEKNINSFYCECGRKYKYISGLSRHKKLCKYSNEYDHVHDVIIDTVDIVDNKNIKQILEIQTQYILQRMDRQDELIQRTIENNNITNIQNNHFCLNIFLNDTCKDAMDLDDFVDSIEVGIEDIEQMEQLDYASGISKLIINKLNQATIVGRPLHCTDSKRETIYIKINANWQKADDELKSRFIQAIKKIAHKNIQAINLWMKKNPEWNDPRSKTNDKYLKIVSNSMSGATEEEQKFNIDKIVKNIIREVKIDKNVNYNLYAVGENC
jgi:hypothetical protein